MPSTPYMGLSLPTPGLSVPDWAGLLNTAFSLLDSHDHSAGHGLQVPSAGININADLTFNGFNLTQARTLRLQQQAAAPALAADAGAIYATTAGDLWFNNGAGQHVQITSGAALSAASLGGISGLGGTSAGSAYSNSTKTFTFTQAANQSALLDAGPLVIHDTAASAFGITLQSPVGIAAAYALTLPAALPVANALLSLGTSGVLSAFGTVSGNDLTLAGKIALSAANPATILATGSNAQIQIQGNRSAADPGDDVAIVGTANRSAGFLAGFWSNVGSAPQKKLQVDYQGLLSLASQAAPLQPASIVTAASAGSGWNSGGSYWKDANGVVHLTGSVRNNDGATATAFTLPVGFRPSAALGFLGLDTSVTAVKQVIVNTDGTVQPAIVGPPIATHIYSVEGITFLAQG